MKHFSTIFIISALTIPFTFCAPIPDIDIENYTPVIDKKYRPNYETDLIECRQLGIVAYKKYQAQKQKEEQQKLKNTTLGALAGAAVGAAIGDSDGSERRKAVEGAATGALVAGGKKPIDYDRIIAKFGPTRVVDKCMENRGYTILSDVGFGGG